MAKKIIITASGGGHTGNAVSLAQRLEGRADILFIVPKGDKWTRQRVEKYGDIIEVTKGRGAMSSNILFIPRFLKAFYESLRSVSKEYEVLVSMGSNHSIPPAFLAKINGLKIINVESCARFTKGSRTVKILSHIADITALQWEEQKNLHPKGIVYGPLFEKPLYKPWNGGYILVTGGTYGHRMLFDALLKTRLKNIVLQTGRLDPRYYKKRKPEWRIFDFDPDFGKWIAGANIVISHFGKTVLDAALTYRKPVIIVPNPEFTRTVGVEDAGLLAKKLNAILLENITPKDLVDAIEFAFKLKVPEYPDGALNLAEDILKL
ncbi:MAG: polysaccharide biosynthesis protein [Thermoprotei archaeon]|nr:MAG: polysaccharide biosynthesis protein [Thermoprotei archaeon]